jgi:hypothetical protein
MSISKAASKLLIGIAFSALVLSGVANAATVNCPGTAVPTTDREFQVDTTTAATCLTSGVGNISGNNDAVNNFIYAGAGFITLDKDPDDKVPGAGLFPNALTIVGDGTTSGTFSFVAPAGFINFVLAFKSGEGQIDPDWAAFLLPTDIVSGLWSILVGNQSLSHANLYAQIDPNYVPPGEVPLPAGIVLLLSALGGIGFLSRFRKATSA